MSENKHTPEPMAWTRPDATNSFISHRKKIANEFQACSMYSIALYSHQDDRVEELTKQRDEIQTKANAMAETINAIAGLCTYQHESKEDFIGRVRAVLGDDPDLRVSSIRRERDDLLTALKLVNPSADCIEHHPKRQQLEAAALWSLWHHQGASSVVGQPIRKLLGMGQFDRLSDDQLEQAKAFGRPAAQATETTVPALVFFPAGSLGEEVES